MTIFTRGRYKKSLHKGGFLALFSVSSFTRKPPGFRC